VIKVAFRVVSVNTLEKIRNIKYSEKLLIFKIYNTIEEE
jgi:hypothetical protein